jgi:glyoxylase-like metal-dependent hydrolase (beta-lactamase superfamily II)
MPIHIETIETTGLGDRSYLVHDGVSGFAVDPQRDIDRVLSAAAAVGVGIELVLETHIHNDYVSGGLQLARQTGAQYAGAAAEPVDFDRTGLAGGETITVGTLTVRALAAPGHTLHHLAYVVEQGGHPRAVFTGGSLLYGTVGRTDLDHRATPEALTRAQYRGVRGLVDGLPDDVSVHPTHGFGSFCSLAASSGSALSTVGEERRANIAFTASGEDDFVDQLLGGLTAYPRYYVHMGPQNRRGPSPIDLAPAAPLDTAELWRRIAAGEWIVDLRGRRAFAQGHIAGTVGVELGDQFATYLGWVLTWGAPLTLVGSAAEIAEAQRALARIGVDQLAGAATQPVTALAGDAALQGYPAVEMTAVQAGFEADRDVILDVRRRDEWRTGHIAGAVHIPLQDLLERLGEVPRRRLWVHCASGFRASIAASLLDRSGFDVVLIDDAFTNAAGAGLTMATVVPPDGSTAGSRRHVVV